MAVRRWLGQTRDWLLIFDNARTAEQLAPYLPQAALGHVLITSRNPQWDEVAQPLAIPVWPRDDSVRYLEQRTGHQNAAANNEANNQLAYELGDLPLALAQAAGYITSKGTTAARYVELFRARRRELWKLEKPPRDYQQTVATTWALTADQLPAAAVDLLRFVAHVAPDRIPRWLFEKAKHQLPAPLAEIAADPLAWDQSIEALRSYALAEVDPEDGSLSVHRLLQATVRDQLAAGEPGRWAEVALTSLRQEFPFQEEDLSSWGPAAELLPHALASVEHAVDLNVVTETSAVLLNECAALARNQGRYAAARELLQRAIAIKEKAYAADHPTLAVSYSNLALVERALGNLTAARELLQRAIGKLTRTR